MYTPCAFWLSAAVAVQLKCKYIFGEWSLCFRSGRFFAAEFCDRDRRKEKNAFNKTDVLPFNKTAVHQSRAQNSALLG